MLSFLLYGLFLVACLVLIVAVLLQPGKADAGALFTSSVSSTAFGPRGTQTILAKITIGAAIVFMLAALLLSLGIGGPRSVLEGGTLPTPTPTPAATASPEAGSSPAASPREGATTSASPQAGAAAGTTASPSTGSASSTASPATGASPENK